jgi:hypothetical protein
MTCEPTDRIMQTLRTNIPGATDPMIELQLFNTVDEFLRRTSTWQVEVPIALQEGITDYALPLPVHSTLVRVLWVLHRDLPVPATGQSGTTIVQTSIGHLVADQMLESGNLSEFDYDLRVATPPSLAYSIFRPDVVTITIEPSADALLFPMMVMGALTVTKDCLEDDCSAWSIPDWMWDTYFHEFLDGTQSKLFGMASKPWTSPTLAAYHAKKFRNRMGFRKQEAPRGFIWGQPGPWRFPGGWK